MNMILSKGYQQTADFATYQSASLHDVSFLDTPTFDVGEERKLPAGRRSLSAFVRYKKKRYVYGLANRKALLSLMSKLFVADGYLCLLDNPHAWIGMRANALVASTTCNFLSMWGAQETS